MIVLWAQESFARLRRYDRALATHMGLASTVVQRLWSGAVGAVVLLDLEALISLLRGSPESSVLAWSSAAWLLGIPCGLLAAWVWLGEVPQREAGGWSRSARRVACWTVLSAILPLLAIR